MKYKLYYDDDSAAMGVRAVLEEIGAPYELLPASIDRSKPEDPELLAHNPNGWIPVLIWEHGSFYECGAIVTFLCDRHPEAKLAPAVNDPERGKFLQWLFFFSSSIQNAFQMSYYPDRFCNSVEDEATAQARSVSRLRELWTIVDDAIGDGPWLLGNRSSAADIYMYMLTTWFSSEHNHPNTDEFPNVKRVVDCTSQLTSVRTVFGPHN